MALFIIGFIRDHACFHGTRPTECIGLSRLCGLPWKPVSRSWIQPISRPKLFSRPWRHTPSRWIRRPIWLCCHGFTTIGILNVFCVSCASDHKTNDITSKSRMDTESCDIFFCLELLIFDSAKWVQSVKKKNNGNNAAFGLEQNSRCFESNLVRREQILAYFYILSIKIQFENINYHIGNHIFL